MSDEYFISETVLPNGLRLLHRRRSGAVAHLALMVDIGMRDELEDENGLAHFIEHLLFKGTKKRKAFHVLSCLENVGGDLNAFTTKEETCIHASFLKEHYSKAIELISDVAFNSIFPENEVEKEKEVILDEINSYLDSPYDEIIDEFENLLYRGHQLGRNILGTIPLVSNYTRNDIISFYSKNYSPDKMILATIGDIDFETFKHFAIKHFGGYNNFGTVSNRLPFTSLPPTKKNEKRTNHLTHCMIGGIAYRYDHPDKLKMILLNNILGGPAMSSRLNLNIREKYGFAYTIESQYNAYSDVGNFTIYLGVDPHSKEKAICLVFKELDKLKQNKLGILQLSNAKKQLIGQVALGNESGLNELLSMARDGFYKNALETLPETISKVEKITADDLLIVANTIFDKENISILTFEGQ